MELAIVTLILAVQSPGSPTLLLVVKALPKNALVEKQVLLHTGRREVQDDEGENVVQMEELAFNKCKSAISQHRWCVLTT